MTTSADRVDHVLNCAKVAAELTINFDNALTGYVPKTQLAAKEAAQLQTRATTMRDTIEQHLKDPEIIRDTNAYMTLIMILQKKDADFLHFVEAGRRVASSFAGELNAQNEWGKHVGKQLHQTYSKQQFTPPSDAIENLTQFAASSNTWHALQGGN